MGGGGVGAGVGTGVGVGAGGGGVGFVGALEPPQAAAATIATMDAASMKRRLAEKTGRSEERRVGKECRL